MKSLSKLKITVVLITLLFVACKGRNDKPMQRSEGTIIEVVPGSNEKISLPDIISSYKYIALESLNNNLIGQVDKILSHDDKIFVLDKDRAKAIFVFNNKGKFLYKIANNLGGPEGYSYIQDFDIDDEKGILHLLDYPKNRMLKFKTSDGSFLEKGAQFDRVDIQEFVYKDGTYFVHSVNSCYDYCSSLVSFSESGEYLGSDLPIANFAKNVQIGGLNAISKNKDRVIVGQYYNDTLYQHVNGSISPLLVVRPKAIDKLDKSLFKHANSNIQKFSNEVHNYYFGPKTLLETDSLIYFESNFRRQILINLYFKESGQFLSSTLIDRENYKHIQFQKPMAVINNKLAGVANAEQLISLRDQIHAEFDEALFDSKFIDILDDLAPDSNPVIVIYSFK